MQLFDYNQQPKKFSRTYDSTERYD